MEYSVFGAARGVIRREGYGVGGVEADADEVNFRHVLTLNELFKERWKGLGGGAEDDLVEGVGVEGLFGADVEGADAALVGDVDEAGGGIDGAGGADDEEGSGAVEFAEMASMSSGISPNQTMCGRMVAWQVLQMGSSLGSS